MGKKNANGFMNNMYKIKKEWQKRYGAVVITTASENDMLYDYYINHSNKEFESYLIQFLNRKREEN